MSATRETTRNRTRLHAFLDTLPPVCRAEVEVLLDTDQDPYDPDEEGVGTSYEHGHITRYLLTLIEALLGDAIYTVYLETNFYIRARRTDPRPRIGKRRLAEPGAPPVLDLSQPDDPPARLVNPYAPDLALVIGQPPPASVRRSYYIGRDGPRPDVAVEVASHSTARFDIQRKPTIYSRHWGVPEYFAFDPRYFGSKPYWTGGQIRGWRRIDDDVVEIEANADGRMWSDGLQSWIGPDDTDGYDWRLWLWDKDGNRRLTGQQIEYQRAHDAEARAEAADAARQEALAQTEAERYAKEMALAEADEATTAKEQALAEADAARARAAALEAEVARLLAELRQRDGTG